MNDAPAVMLIGIDGGTFTLIEPWVRAGYLPAIETLLAGGCSGRLRSTNPPLTPVAWSSMLTGCNPGKHGMFAFLDMPRDGYEPRFLNGGALRVPMVMEIASAHGLRVGSLNVPWTWPPRPVDGFCLSGLDAPGFGPEIAHPPGLFEELAERFDGYFPKIVAPEHDGYALDLLDETIEKIGAMSRHLVQTRPVDLFAVVFVSTDHIQHWFWHDRRVRARDGRSVDDLLLYVYRRVDEQIGRLIAECAGPETVTLLVSDHGAGPCAGGINLNRWLQQQGWLEFAEAPGAGRSLRTAALWLGARLLPGALRERLRGRLSGMRRTMLSRVLATGIDWPATSAFCWSDYGALSVHAEDRFADGQVPEEAREELVEEIAGRLLALRHPETGERVMSAPLRAEEVYHGSRLADAPDLVVVPRSYRWEILSEFTPSGPLPAEARRGVFSPSRRQGTHRLHGVLCAAGRGIRAGRRLTGARIEDVAATVLHLLGLPVPEYMDGRVLSEMLSRERLAQRPPERRPLAPRTDEAGAYSAEQAARIERDLDGLGYL